MNKKVFKYFIMAVMLSGVCFAEPETENIRSFLKASSYEPNYFSILMSLVFVIFLIYITGILYTKLNKFGVKTVKQEMRVDSDIKPVVLSTTPIGHDRVLQVVEINGERLLLGCSPSSVNLIKSLGREIKVEQFVQKEKEIRVQELEPETVKKDEHTVNADDFGLYKKYLR